MKHFFFPDHGVTIEAPTREEALAVLEKASAPAADGVESRRKKRPSPR